MDAPLSISQALVMKEGSSTRSGSPVISASSVRDQETVSERRFGLRPCHDLFDSALSPIAALAHSLHDDLMGR
jgi:hypothetical protein